MFPMRILVVEDDEEFRTSLVERLETLGHQVATAPDGSAGLDNFREGDFDVVVSDWLMPGLNGLELCRSIRQLARTRYPHLILLSAMDRQGDYVQALDAGADDFLRKPVETAELAARLRVAERMLRMHTHIQRLEGILSMCASCKRIRGDAGKWVPIETHFSQHSDLRISHGLCPDCCDVQLRGLGH